MFKLRSISGGLTIIIVGILFSVFSSIHSQSTPFPPIEDTIVEAGDLGKIQGSYSLLSRPLYGNRDYYYYYTGIPYADTASYTGSNRFKVYQKNGIVITNSRKL